MLHMSSQIIIIQNSVSQTRKGKEGDKLAKSVSAAVQECVKKKQRGRSARAILKHEEKRWAAFQSTGADLPSVKDPVSAIWT